MPRQTTLTPTPPTSLLAEATSKGPGTRYPSGDSRSMCLARMAWLPNEPGLLPVSCSSLLVILLCLRPRSGSDLRFTPKNGIAPYTLIISPAMHPPVNITSNSTFASDNSMNYTIRLTHGMPFFATIFDDNGASWSSGPYHAGTNQNVGCLATLTGQEFVGGQMPDTAPSSGRSGGVSVGALAGGIAGAFVVGAVLAGLVMFLLAKRKKRSNHVSRLISRTYT